MCSFVPSSLLAGQIDSIQEGALLILSTRNVLVLCNPLHQHAREIESAVGRSIHLPPTSKSKTQQGGLPGPARAQLERASVEGGNERAAVRRSLEFLAKQVGQRENEQAGRLCRWALPARLAPFFRVELNSNAVDNVRMPAMPPCHACHKREREREREREKRMHK